MSSNLKGYWQIIMLMYSIDFKHFFFLNTKYF